jgi:hypothetical protein
LFFAVIPKLDIELHHFLKENLGTGNSGEALKELYIVGAFELILRLEDGDGLLVHRANVSSSQELKVFTKQLVKLHKVYLILFSCLKHMLKKLLQLA